MAYDIGPKIGIDGEAEFRKSLQAINQQLRTLGSEMKAVTSSFLEGDESQEALAAQTDVLNRQIDAQRQKLSQLQKGLEASAQKYGENDTRTLKWAQAVHEATADLNQMQAKLAKTEGGLDGLADATEEAGAAAEAAGGKFGTMTVAMGNLISSGIQTAVSAAADLVGTLFHLDETTEEYRKNQGLLNTAFEKAGYSAATADSAYQSLYRIIGDSDVATEAAQQMASLSKSQENFAAWAKIGAGVAGVFGDALPLNNLYEAANETSRTGTLTGQLTDAILRAGHSEEEFNQKLAEAGTEAERNQLILETLSDYYDGASEAFYRNNEAMMASREAQAQMDASLGALGETIADVKTRLTAELTPALAGVVAAFGSVLSGESGAGAALAGSIAELVNGVSALAPEVLAAGVETVGALVSGIAQSLPAVLAAGGELLTELTAGVLTALPALTASPPAAVGEFLTALTQQLPQIIAQGVEVLNALVSGILSAIPDLVAALPQVLSALFDFLAAHQTSVLAAGVDILLNLVSGLLEAIPELVAALPEIISAITQGMAKAAPELIQSGFTLLIRLTEGILSAVPELVAVLPQIIQAVIEGIRALMGGIVDIGEGIVEGLWQGIQNMAGWIKSKVIDFFSGIVDSAKDLLGIHSPSTVFAGMGKNMALGLGEGFKDEMRLVQRDIDRSMGELAGPSLSAPNPVETASEKGQVRSQDAVSTALADAVRSALQGAAVYLNGRRVGTLITQQQNAATVARGQTQVYL